MVFGIIQTVPPIVPNQRIECFLFLMLRTHRGSWIVPMVPDYVKLGVAGELQTCSDIAFGFCK